ncbi:MAG: hypothetical protein P4M15_10085 [Alphaproteobacteria bacterium]|nr:hypothetical protein [Alphaproteobacteria bacterium]
MIEAVEEPRRRHIAVAMLDEEIGVLRDARQVFRGGVFPADILLPGSLKFAEWGIDAARLPPAGVLKSYILYLQEAVILPAFDDFITERTENAHENLLAVQIVPDASNKIVDEMVERYKGYMAGTARQPVSDKEAYAHFSLSVARAGLVWDVEEVAYNEVSKKAMRHMGAPSNLASVMPFPSPDMRRLTRDAMTYLISDVSNCIGALEAWRTAEKAVSQRKSWLKLIAAGHHESFVRNRDYRGALRQVRLGGATPPKPTPSS